MNNRGSRLHCSTPQQIDMGEGKDRWKTHEKQNAKDSYAKLCASKERRKEEIKNNNNNSIINNASRVSLCFCKNSGFPMHML